MNSVGRKKKFEVGRAHFNAKKFFEAHEFWEEIWLLEAEPEKTFLQGLIQVTAAFYHYQRKNPDGAESLLASGIVKLSRFPDDHHGLAMGELRTLAKQWARALGSGKDLGEGALPKLKRMRSSLKSVKTSRRKSARVRPKARQ
jgi:hypothetical protein